MKVFGVRGPAAHREAAVDRVVRRLADRGRVAVVDAAAGSRAPEGLRAYRESGAATAVGLDDGEWTATGGSRSLADVLDDLAQSADYAVVLGRPGADLPSVVVGDPDADGTDERGSVLLRVESASALDLDELEDALADVEPRETLESLVERVKRSPEEVYAGAIATFTGRVRAKDHPDDDETEHLAFERYGDVVEERMAEIRSTLESREGVYEVRLHHRTGVMEAGEDIVFVVVLAGHRSEAFETVEDGIDRLKEVVPLFKKEVTVEEEFWAHERD